MCNNLLTEIVNSGLTKMTQCSLLLRHNYAIIIIMPLHLVGKMVGTVLGDDEVLSDRQPVNYEFV